MNYDLPKSPCIRFEGKQIHLYEAFTLLVRTSHSFDRSCALFNLLERHHKINLKDVHKYLKSIGFIVNDLYYLNNYYYDNTSGILKGICNLDGTFNSFNLAKHPSYESVYKELEIIAKSFIFLNITATVYDKCITEDSKKPLFSFRISNGKLTSTSEHLESLPYISCIQQPYIDFNHIDRFIKLISNYKRINDYKDFNQIFHLY